jgi:hypothetical protein
VVGTVCKMLGVCEQIGEIHYQAIGIL